MYFVNLTPHPLNIKTTNGDFVTIPPDESGPARVIYDTLPPEQVVWGDDSDVIFEVTVAGVPREIVGLPEYGLYGDVVYIVSKAVADAASRHRDDLMSPGRLLRAEDGRVIGCDGLTRRA